MLLSLSSNHGIHLTMESPVPLFISGPHVVSMLFCTYVIPSACGCMIELLAMTPVLVYMENISRPCRYLQKEDDKT